MKPQIVAFEAAGWHNADPTKSKDRLLRGGSYRNQSTVCIIPSLGAIHPKVVGAWMAMLTPMNQKFLRLWPMNMEIGDAYSSTIEGILADPELSKWKYVLTLETDNIPPPDGLIRLLETIEGGVDGRKYDVVGSLYWTKGHGGQPMIYGNPGEFPLSFVPQVPVPNAIQPCHGLGMGFTLFRLKMFQDPRLPRPLFRTVSEVTPGVGTRVYTQDLHFFENAGGLGYKFASDNRVLTGHYSESDDILW